MSLYRGGIGQWAWLLHRLSGLGVLLFLVIHILDTALVLWGADLYNRVIAIYRMPIFGIGEIGLFAAVLFHALNGIRVVAVDFRPAWSVYHKQMFQAVVVLFFLIFIPVAVIMTGHILEGMHG
ncbi:MAG: succinate dehydrogenase, cytochrome b556 subunit [Candidatus Omnitrophica bacterium CG11_big_fil_rev_8_21_14_0_20_64_10]|nr:MAG: succinate dehydrogenase, cytochrome b556 subunit [Candidatus Omnitrophica bacterium CG11_big_fil_rev_8_21_14_0_20_64_10]